MSRTSAALIQDLLGGPEATLLSPLESSVRVSNPMHLFMAQTYPDEIAGILADRTGFRAKIKQATHPHSWVQVNKARLTVSFMCECGAFFAVSFTPSVIDMTKLVPNRYQAAFTLKSYLENALRHDPRNVNISETTMGRLSLDVLQDFGWEVHETFWAPPQQPDPNLYAMALAELDFIMATETGQAIDSTAQLYQLFGADYIPYIKTPSQKLLGCARGDSDEMVYNQYLHQIRLDPTNVAYYFDALRDLASESEFLQLRFMEQESLGVVSLSEIKTAYQDFGLVIADQVDDDAIISIYSESPKTLSRSLAVLADHRESTRLRRLAAATGMSYSDAMHILGIDESSQETLIASRANTLHSSPDIVVRYEAEYALLQIATQRKSPQLLALYENLHPPEPVTSDPYDYFGISPTLDDENIVAAFELITQDEAPSRQIELRSYLRAIAEHRQSQALHNYLESGLLLYDGETEQRPVGLWNIGNTCYLNSLLQFYNTVVPFREALGNLDAQENDDSIAKKKVGGRLVPYTEVSRSQKFLGALNTLFCEMETTRDRYVTPSEELAYMALVPPREDVTESEAQPESEPEPQPQPLEDIPNETETPELDHSSLDLHEDAMGEKAPEDEDEEPMRVDDSPPPPSLTLALPAPPASEETADELYKQKLHQALERQQDVTECIENVLYQVEAGVRAKGYDEDGEQKDLVKDLFYGNIVQTLRNEDKSDKRVKNERVSSIMVNVADKPQNIYTALDGYFAAEKIELSEGLFERTVALSTMPPILQIQVQRVQFDRKTYQLFKNNNPITLEETLYMDRYAQTEDPAILEKRAERVRLQQEKQELEAQLESLSSLKSNNCTKEANLAKTAEWMESYLDDNPDKEDSDSISSTLAEINEVIEKLKETKTAVQTRLSEINEVLDTQFDQYRKYGYRLHSLFIHRGQASHGHYWIYIKDFEQNQFLKYNDETVSIIPDSEVFDYTPGNTATPYFIVYIREDFVDQVKSVNRSVEGGTSELIPISAPAEVEHENPFADGMSIDNPITIDPESPVGTETS